MRSRRKSRANEKGMRDEQESGSRSGVVLRFPRAGILAVWNDHMIIIPGDPRIMALLKINPFG
jgi:hypothetical protein